MLSNLSVESREPRAALLALSREPGWRLIRDVMPSETDHRIWMWEVAAGASVVHVEDMRFGASYFVIEGEGRAEAEVAIRARFGVVEPEALFARAHDVDATIGARIRALCQTIAHVSAEHEDPAYAEMLRRFIGSPELDLARAALLLAERLRWRSLAQAVEVRAKEPNTGPASLAPIARRVLGTLWLEQE